jgi:hypothetical protein
MKEVQVRLEAASPAPDRDQVTERPEVLGRQPDALRVRDAPHDGRRHRGSEMHVELGQRRSWIEAWSWHRHSFAGVFGGV